MKKAKLIEPKTLGSFKILKEKRKSFVVWDIEMTEDMKRNLIKIGKKVAKEDPNVYINIGLLDILEEQVESNNGHK